MGFMTSKLGLLAIASAIIVVMGVGLKYEIEKNGTLNAEKSILQANQQYLESRIQAEHEAQNKAIEGQQRAQREATAAKQKLSALESKYAALLSLALPPDLIVFLQQSICSVNGNCTSPKSDSQLPAP